jgi:hypothetical protein
LTGGIYEKFKSLLLVTKLRYKQARSIAARADLLSKDIEEQKMRSEVVT